MTNEQITRFQWVQRTYNHIEFELGPYFLLNAAFVAPEKKYTIQYSQRVSLHLYIGDTEEYKRCSHMYFESRDRPDKNYALAHMYFDRYCDIVVHKLIPIVEKILTGGSVVLDLSYISSDKYIKAFGTDICGRCNKSVSELRPYGPNASPLCFQCGLSETETYRRQLIRFIYNETRS